MIPHLKHNPVWFWQLEKKRIESNLKRSTGIIPTVARIELHHYNWFLLIPPESSWFFVDPWLIPTILDQTKILQPTPAMSAENQCSFTVPRMCSLRARLRIRQVLTRRSQVISSWLELTRSSVHETVAILNGARWLFWILLMNAAFKLSESISKILLSQVNSPYDSEKSFDESLILNRI